MADDAGGTAQGNSENGVGSVVEAEARLRECQAQLMECQAQLMERDLRLRQYVPKHKYNEVVDELQMLQAQLGGDVGIQRPSSQPPAPAASLSGSERASVGSGRISPPPPTAEGDPTTFAVCGCEGYTVLITNAEVTESGKGHLAYEIALCQQDTVVSIIRKRYSNFANLRSLLLHTQAAEAALSGATVQGTEDAFMQASAADAAAAAAVAAGDLAAARASALHELLKLLPFPAKSWRSVRTTAVMPPPRGLYSSSASSHRSSCCFAPGERKGGAHRFAARRRPETVSFRVAQQCDCTQPFVLPQALTPNRA